MTTQPDMFGGETAVPDKALKDPVPVDLNVVDQSPDALLVDHARGFAMDWLPKSLCAWGGDMGRQTLPVERWKADQMGWTDAGDD